MAQRSHIYKGVWSVLFRGRAIIGRLVATGEPAQGQTPYDAPWTLEANDGPVTVQITAPRRRFRRPPLGAMLSEADLAGTDWGDDSEPDTAAQEDA